MYSKEEAAKLRQEFWISFGKSFPHKWILYKTKVKSIQFRFYFDAKKAMVCGGGILPAVQGAVADVVGYVESYWVIVLALAFLLFYALVGSKNVNTDIKVD